MSVVSFLYTDYSTEVADATVVLQRSEVQYRVTVKDWVQSNDTDVYPGLYVSCLYIMSGTSNWCK